MSEEEPELVSEPANTRKVPDLLQKLLDEAAEFEEEGDKHGWLQKEHSDDFIRRAEAAEEEIADMKIPDLNAEDQQTLRQLALDEPLIYKTRSGEECTVYLVGSDHDTRETAEDVRAVAEAINPDYICAEHPPEYKFTEELGDLWEKYDGDVEKMATFGSSKHADLHTMKVVGHIFRNDAYTDQIREWGTVLSVDVGMCALMARQFKVPLKWIDISEHAHDKKFGPVWDHVAMHVTMKKVFGIDCIDLGLDIGRVYCLLGAAELMPVPIMRLDQDIEDKLAPNIHVLGTHTRDIYMTHRIHQICEANPGKTILAVVGAFHALNMRDMWNYRMPEALVSAIGSEQKTRKHLHKAFRRYGGRINSPARNCNYKLFAKRT